MTPGRDAAPVRCPWPGSDPLYVDYHDREWGTPLREDRALFELLVLEGFQAGLSWLTILRRREGFREAFGGFDPEAMAAYGPQDVDRLMQDGRIIRNRMKIEAARANARAFLALRNARGGFGEYIWEFVGGRPVVNAWTRVEDIPAATPLSDTLSRDLKKRGFVFVGPTIVYAFMQSAGLVNDHLAGCFRYAELAGRP